MPASPTELTLRKWRKAGYQCAIVEKWNPHVKIRQDLYGFVDVLAVGQGETVAIQCTSRDNVGSRITKIRELQADKGVVAPLQDAGWRIVVEGWRKRANRWECREEVLPAMAEEAA